VRGKLGEAGDAVGQFAVGLCQLGNFRFNVPSSCSSSCLRSGLTDSAPPIFASISLMVFSIMV